MNRQIEKLSKQRLTGGEEDLDPTMGLTSGSRMAKKYNITYLHDKRMAIYDKMDELALQPDSVAAKAQYKRMVDRYGTREQYFLNTASILREYNDGEGLQPTRKRHLTLKYLTAIGENEPVDLEIDEDDLNTCGSCGGGIVEHCSEGMVVCTKCGIARTFLKNGVSNYTFNQLTQEQTQTTRFTYDRMSHFCDKLAQFQAKEYTMIPEDVMAKIETELKKEKTVDLTEFTKLDMKKILKKTGLSQYYEHSNYLIVLLSGAKPLQLDGYTEETLKLMFKHVESPFEKYKHIMKETSKMNDRKSFLNYNYVLRKFFEILEMKDCADQFPLLKNLEKVRAYDRVWYKICEELNWPFYRSV